MERKPLRVLVTAFAVVPGSSPHAAAVLGLASALHAEMDIVTVKAEALSHNERFGDARMLRVPVGVASEREQRRTFCRAVRRQLEGEPYDIVHVRGPHEGEVAAELRESLGFRLVYEVGSFPDENEGPDADAEWERAHARLVASADLVVVPTEAAKRSAVLRELGDKVVVVSPGVDVDLFDRRAKPETPEPRLLYLGGLSADRDIATLLGALRLVQREIPVRALLAGEHDPERRVRTRDIANSFELRAVVDVRGEPQPLLLPQLIAAADVVLVPAAASPRFREHGDLPQPLVEHLACAKAVVAAGVPGVAEILRDEQEGLLYPPGDEEAFAEAIITLLRDTEMRERVTASAYERARALFSGGARRRALAGVYERIAPGSQQLDPWAGAFETEATGLVAVPDDLGAVESEPSHSTGPQTIDPGAPLPRSELPREPTPPIVTPHESDDGVRFDTQPGPTTDPHRVTFDTQPGTLGSPPDTGTTALPETPPDTGSTKLPDTQSDS